MWERGNKAAINFYTFLVAGLEFWLWSKLLVRGVSVHVVTVCDLHSDVSKVSKYNLLLGFSFK